MRLIDADELIYMEYGGIEFVPTEFIKEAPTIDAVPVVRCKDCKYRLRRGNEVYKCEVEIDLCDPYEIGRKPYEDDWFCADGDRRADDEKT